jgi:hypothetical protein
VSHESRSVTAKVAIAVATLICACDRPAEPEPQQQPARTASATPAAEQPAQRSIVFSDPPRWKRKPAAGAMRKATFEVPASGAGEPGEVSVFNFGAGQGGGVDANVERWVKQFPGLDPSKVKKSKRVASGLTVHVVEIDEGTFSSGMPGGPSTPKPGWGLVGAIVEAPDGNWFFKLVGPRATVDDARGEFFGLIDGIKPSG